MILPAPTTPRQLFTLFLFYDKERGVDDLVRHLRFQSLDMRQIYYSVLGRLPEKAALSVAPPDYDPARHLCDALQSEEFQRDILKLLCNAFPELRRVIFLHIPKCAGTDLVSHLCQQYPSINNTWSRGDWTTKAGLFDELAGIVAQLLYCPALLIHGHIRLQWLLGQGLIRFTDECFTVVRDPFEIALSQVNYVVTRLSTADRHAAPTPDIENWICQLGLDRRPVDASETELLQLARAALSTPNIVVPNTMCRQFGGVDAAGRATAASALDNIILSNLELTDTTRYNAWHNGKFRTGTNTRLNESRKFLTAANISKAETEQINALISEDYKLYSKIIDALHRTEGASIRGELLA